MILQIALPVPIDRLFDYLPRSEDSERVLQPGIRVQVRFGPRQMIGLIVEVKNDSEIEPGKLRAIEQYLDQTPLIPKEMMDFGLWAASYYQHPIGEALFALLPTLARKHLSPARTESPVWTRNQAFSNASLPKRATKQHELLKLFEESGQPLSREEIEALGFSRSVFDALKAQGAISPTDRDLISSRSNLEHSKLLREPVLRPNPAQKKAVDHIREKDCFAAFLLFGVTGSGKTEVYLQTIESVVSQGKQALILVPEIGLTPQLVQRFKNRFNRTVYTLHSGMTDRARFDTWYAARQGEAQILIGTRSSIFVPLKNPGLIIIDEEHDASFKQQDGFRYNARDLALVRGKHHQIPVVMGSATPALESLANVDSGRYTLLKLEERAGDAQAPQFKCIDLRQQNLDCGIAHETLLQIQRTLARNEQVLVFINRRGFSPSLICQQCATPVDCTRCDAHMTLHRRPPRLHCHHCDRQTPIPKTCAACGAQKFQPTGVGTERIEDRLVELFPDTPVLRVDRDSTRTKSAFDQLMSNVNQENPCILVGTQMLAKGHHFPAVTLVVILNADAGLFSADLRGPERMAQLTLQVAGRAGRAEKPGTVLLQTLYADHPLLSTLINEGYLRFAEEELLTRKNSGLPPYRFMALIQAESKQQGVGEAYLCELKQQLNDLPDQQVQCTGPFPNAMEKRIGFYRAQLILSATTRASLQNRVTRLRGLIDASQHRSRVRLSIDIDPIDTL